MNNRMKIEFLSKSANEAFARTAVAAFVTQLDPNLEELADIKTAVSEAVTNAIVHGYNASDEIVIIECELTDDRTVKIFVTDQGKGIENIQKAMEPLFTTSPETERSGMGFTVMETFMDSIEVSSTPGNGTTVQLIKKIKTKTSTH